MPDNDDVALFHLYIKRWVKHNSQRHKNTETKKKQNYKMKTFTLSKITKCLNYQSMEYFEAIGLTLNQFKLHSHISKLISQASVFLASLRKNLHLAC